MRTLLPFAAVQKMERNISASSYIGPQAATQVVPSRVETIRFFLGVAFADTQIISL
ncbi:hypothetical protein SAMN04515695_0754 [Pseudovibrio sp. Tun.PSC04-5.I4]|nr:hypothetical protein SAMN04515695_0754 [Pseudovibrio sp. Tun.PSC04-5.I4]